MGREAALYASMYNTGNQANTISREFGFFLFGLNQSTGRYISQKGVFEFSKTKLQIDQTTIVPIC